MNNALVVVSAFVVERPKSTPRPITRPIMKPTNPSNTLLHAEEGKNNNLLDSISMIIDADAEHSKFLEGMYIMLLYGKLNINICMYTCTWSSSRYKYKSIL